MRKTWHIFSTFITCSVLILAITLTGQVKRASAITQSLIPFTTAGDQGNGRIGSGMIGVSTNGRYIAFASTSSDLVSGDTNSKIDVFVRDTVLNSTAIASVSTGGVEANQDVAIFEMSGNGRYILMTTTADNLASMSPTTNQSVFLRDMKTGTTELIGAATDSPISSFEGDAISEDGRFVYYSESGSTTGLYVKDRLLNTTTRVDTDSSGTAANALGSSISTSCDGRYVVFSSPATNLVSGDTNGNTDIFIVDTMSTHTMKDITLGADKDSIQPHISCDGNYVLFNSWASNLVTGDTNSAWDTFVYSVADESITRASVSSSGSQYPSGCTITSTGCPDYSSYGGSMNGRYVAMRYLKRTGTSPDYTYSSAIVVKDLQTGALTQVSQTTGAYCNVPIMAFDGSKVYYVASSSSSTNDTKLYVATSYL